MKRIDIVYGGELYSVGGREFEEVRQEVVDGTTDGPSWLRVNDGEGMRREAYLLLSPGVPIALIPVPEDDIELAGDGQGLDVGVELLELEVQNNDACDDHKPNRDEAEETDGERERASCGSVCVLGNAARREIEGAALLTGRFA